MLSLTPKDPPLRTLSVGLRNHENRPIRTSALQGPIGSLMVLPHPKALSFDGMAGVPNGAISSQPNIRSSSDLNECSLLL